MQVRVCAMLGTLLLAAACSRERVTPTTPGCNAHAECTDPRQPFCVDNLCVACTNDEQCGCHASCVEHECLTLGAPDESMAQNAHGNWLSQPGEEDYRTTGFCARDGDCTAGDLCNPFTAGCVEPPDPSIISCATHDCVDGYSCDPTTKRCYPAALCTSNRNCCGFENVACGGSPETPGLCLKLECTPPDLGGAAPTCPFAPRITTECSNSTFCSLAGRCVQCTCDADCAGEFAPRCDVVTGLCSDPGFCRTPEECGEGESCDRTALRCRPRCQDESVCMSFEDCDPTDAVCRCLADSYEPNEAVANAGEIETPAMESSVTVNGTLCPDDRDWFQIQLTAGDQIDVSGSTGGGNVLVADILAYASDQITTLDSTELGARTLSFSANSDGVYYLQLRQFGSAAQGSSGMYTFQVTRTQGVVCDLGGLNNTPTTATLLNTGETVANGCELTSGSLAALHTVACNGTMRICDEDLDFYLIEVPARAALTATVDNLDTDVDLMLYGPYSDMEPPSTDRLVDSVTDASPEAVVSTLTRGEAHYLLAVEPAWYGDYFDYDLEIEIGAGPACEEDIYDQVTDTPEAFDPSGVNDTPISKSGVALTAGAHDFALTLCAVDLDWFVLGADNDGTLSGLPSGQRLRLELINNTAGTEDDLLGFFGTEIDEVAAAVEDLYPSYQSGQITTEGGLYYLAVTPGAGVSTPISYTLRATLIPEPTCSLDGLGDLPMQRNDDPEMATELTSPPWPEALGDPAYTFPPATGDESLSSCSLDNDWYVIDVPNDVAARFTVEYDNEVAELGLAVFDQSVVGVDVLPGVPPTTGRLGIRQANQVGRQSVRAEHAGPMLAMVYNRSHWPVEYVLTVELGPPPCAPDPLEPNNTAATAKPLGLSGSLTEPGVDTATFPALGACTGDDDYFLVPLEPGDELEVSILFERDDGALGLRLYHPDHLSSAVATASGSGDLLSLSYTSAQSSLPATYVLLVAPAGTNNRNTYALEARAQRWCEDDRFQPSTFEQQRAVSLPVDEIAYGSMKLCKDEDWFAVSVEEDTDVSVCSRFLHSQGDIDLAVYDVLAAPASATPIATSRTKEDQEEIVFAAAAGTTYHVRAYLDYRSPTALQYALWILQGSGGCPPLCADHVTDGDESDVDCGGTCDTCEVGYACRSGTDCASGACNGDICD